MTSVNFIQQDGQRKPVDVAEGVSVMRAALESGIDGIVGECGGELSCATCHVYIDQPWAECLSPQTQDELDLLEFTDAYRAGVSRLGCQVKIADQLDGMEITVAPED